MGLQGGPLSHRGLRPGDPGGREVARREAPGGAGLAAGHPARAGAREGGRPGAGGGRLRSWSLCGLCCPFWLLFRRRLHDVVANGVTDHLRAVVEVELVEDVADVELDRVLADAELLGEP